MQLFNDIISDKSCSFLKKEVVKKREDGFKDIFTSLFKLVGSI
jgi:hypothetical protein